MIYELIEEEGYKGKLRQIYLQNYKKENKIYRLIDNFRFTKEELAKINYIIMPMKLKYEIEIEYCDGLYHIIYEKGKNAREFLYDLDLPAEPIDIVTNIEDLEFLDNTYNKIINTLDIILEEQAGRYFIDYYCTEDFNIERIDGIERQRVK